MHEESRKLLGDEARNGSLVVFVGSGVSSGAGLPTWSQLLDPLLAQLGVKGTSSDLLDAAQWYADAFGRAPLLRHVGQALAVSCIPSALHVALAGIRAPVYLTTNYDRLMEAALEQVQGVPPDVVIGDGQVALIAESRRTTVIKLHGCLSLPETIVLTRDDYETYADHHRAMIAYLQSLLATRTVLFAGVSLTEPNFRTIHQVIRRALGEYNRTAYLVNSRPWPEHINRYWESRGIRILESRGKTDNERDARVIAFVEDVAKRGRRDVRGLDAAFSLGNTPPPIQVQPLVDRIQAVPVELKRLLAGVRAEGLLKQDRSITAEVPEHESGQVPESGLWLRDKARSLLDLSISIDALAPIGDDEFWIQIGDTLYDQRDSLGAIRAYSVVLRPAHQNRVVDSPTLLHVYGNLARAYAREGHHSRAEWLLRRCVFQSGTELPEGEPSSSTVFARLNQTQLMSRPTDAGEFAYVMSRRAERLIGETHYDAAFTALREARHALAPVVGQTPNGRNQLGYFDLDQTENGRAWGKYERYVGRTESRRSSPKAYALNHLGKCYRLSASVAPLLGMRDAPYYRKWADHYLCESSKCDPNLPYPYGHRFLLASDPYAPPADRKSLLKSLADALEVLARDSEGDRVAAAVVRHLPARSASDPGEVTTFRVRVEQIAAG